MTIGELLSQVMDWIYAFWPFRLVRDWEQGVRCLLGNATDRLTSENGLFGTGLHWFWPGVGEIIVCETNIEVVETGLQTILSIEDSPVTFSLGLKYRIGNLKRMYEQIHDPADTLCNEVASTAGYVVSHMEVESIPDRLCDAVLLETKEQLGEWGIDIVSLRLMNFSEAQPIRLIGNTPQVANGQ